MIAVGLGYGDESKGSTVDALTAHYKAKLVVRFNSGAQAAHHVLSPAGQVHCFSQFGSGTFAGARTHLSRFMLVNPIALDAEANHLRELGIANPHSLVTIDEEAPVTTPFHQAANRLKEQLRGKNRHGSCGMGIGETMRDVVAGTYLRVGDLRDLNYTREILRDTQKRKASEFQGQDIPSSDGYWKTLTDPKMIDRCLDWYEGFCDAVDVVPGSWLQDELKGEGTVIFEGAQGVLLDQNYGFFPHVTYSNTTFDNAEKLIEGTGIKPVKLGVLRAHMTRHGAGPFVTETPGWNPAGDHNQTGDWQGSFRYGHLDLVALRYSLKVVGKLDGLCLTHLDQVSPFVCNAYEIADQKPILDLQPLYKADRVGQAMLTDLLFTAKPRLGYMREEAAKHIAHWLETPLFTTSNGPRRADVDVVDTLP